MKNKGFTLVELMLTVSAFSIFAFFMYRNFFDEQRFFMTLHRQIDLQYNGSTALEYISGGIRNDIGLSFDANNDGIIYADDDTLLMDFSGTLKTGEINFYSEDRSLKDKANNTLCRNVENVEVIPLVINPDGTEVKDLNGDIIKVVVSLASGSGSRRVEYTAKTYINIAK